MSFYSQVFVSPPLHRAQPYWYANNFVVIAASFAASFSRCPDRLLILPPYECSSHSFSVDGVHFTPGEGERYVHLKLNFCYKNVAVDRSAAFALSFGVKVSFALIDYCTH